LGPASEALPLVRRQLPPDVRVDHLVFEHQQALVELVVGKIHLLHAISFRLGQLSTKISNQ
jgi:hypothetical protein